MVDYLFPFYTATISLVLAQLLKPLFVYMKTKKWELSHIGASGGFPSSHSSLVSALTLSVGLIESFSSTLFAVTAAFSLIILYDAANVRYYSGQNIKITKQLLKDIQESIDIKLDDPIYNIKLKEVLGHKWIEVFGGIILGAIITLIVYYICMR